MFPAWTVAWLKRQHCCTHSDSLTHPDREGVSRQTGKPVLPLWNSLSPACFVAEGLTSVTEKMHARTHVCT